MKICRNLSLTLFACAAALVSTTATASTENSQNAVALITKSIVKSAVAITLEELNSQVQTEVLTAAHHFSPEIDSSMLVARVDITDVENGNTGDEG